MNYTITATRAEGDHVVTTVVYTFAENSTASVDVWHFRPQSTQDVIDGIESRYLTEQSRIAAEIENAAIVEQLRDLVVSIPTVEPEP